MITETFPETFPELIWHFEAKAELEKLGYNFDGIVQTIPSEKYPPVRCNVRHFHFLLDSYNYDYLKALQQIQEIEK